MVASPCAHRYWCRGTRCICHDSAGHPPTDGRGGISIGSVAASRNWTSKRGRPRLRPCLWHRWESLHRRRLHQRRRSSICRLSCMYDNRPIGMRVIADRPTGWRVIANRPIGWRVIRGTILRLRTARAEMTCIQRTMIGAIPIEIRAWDPRLWPGGECALSLFVVVVWLVYYD